MGLDNYLLFHGFKNLGLKLFYLDSYYLDLNIRSA